MIWSTGNQYHSRKEGDENDEKLLEELNNEMKVI
jgi:hypothetical protein